jgi:hypothetical protein
LIEIVNEIFEQLENKAIKRCILRSKSMILYYKK